MGSPARTFGFVFGAVYLVVGLYGFVVTGFEGFAPTSTDEFVLGLFEVNPLHNVVHVLIGVALLAGAGAGELTARSIVLLVAAIYTIVGVLGFFIVGTDVNILALNQADNWLHLGTALLAFGAAAASSNAGRTTPT